MVKVESKKLLELVSVASLNGKIPSVVLNFKKDGIHIQSKDKENLVMNTVFMPSENFELYKEISNPVGIKSSIMMINVLKSFAGIVNVEITEDLFTIYNEKKAASLKIGNVTYLSDYNISVVPPFFEKFDAGANVNSEIFKNAIKNFSIVASEAVNVSVEDKVLSIQVGEKISDRITEKVECGYKNFNSSYNSVLVKQAVDVLPEDINFSVIGDSVSPIQFKFTTEVVSARLLVSPNSAPVKKEAPKKKEVPKKVTTETGVNDLVEDSSEDTELL